MGDRAVIKFSTVGQDQAAVYLHWGGSDARATLKKFFAADEANPAHDNRFNDPQYLAARFIVWMSKQSGTGVGVALPTDQETTNWRVHCDDQNPPRVEKLQ